MRRTLAFAPTAASLVALVGLPIGEAAAASGGPDGFGYTFVDQADGATHAYVDITATGTVIGNGDDTLFPATNLGAPFTFYGETVGQLRASSNGFLTSTLGTDANFSNVCPLPAVQLGGGFRIAALHDDLVSTVYYQYFDQAGAAAVGYPGQAAGISVFQWTGQHFGGPGDDFVDVEVILFHEDDAILSMVALDFEAGLGSTLGIQNADATIGLQYSCNATGGTVPGTTAVLYLPPRISINELRIDQPGGDNDEYFELRGPPGTPLDGLHYIVVGDGAVGVTGNIEAVVNLAGQAIPASGYYVAAEATFTLAPRDATVVLNYENTDTTTHMLVSGFTGAVGTLIDPNFDGVVDNMPWAEVVDAIAIRDPGDVDLPYGPGATCVEGPYCHELTIAGVDPGHFFRCGDGSGGWNEGAFNHLAVPSTDSPGEPNPCGCGDGIVVGGEACDAAGESAACDVDCTAAACGDGYVNAAAGEVCDDGGESAMCDVDCTAAVCGDGVANLAAGEACDDGGESAACNADCTVAACGDGQINAAAGEACDDGGESATCDADCTAAACGDGHLNPSASEACDDGGESATCDVDCTAATCGDLVVNMTAGETCDDGGRSPTCNADCTSALCGDGIVNAAAGEACDGDGMGTPGPTATCDDDCTAAACGDGVTNAAAGEACDDAGESAACDDDCTAATCGDGYLNAAAGEECDDGNADDGDGCSADCALEGGGSTGEGSTGGGSTGEGSTGEGSTGEGSTSGGSTSGGSTGGGSTGGGSTGGVDTGVDETAGDSGQADSSGAGPVSLSGPAETGQDTETDTVGVVPGGDGCSCASAGEGRDGGWSVLAWLGGLLGIVRRRRSSKIT